MLGIVINLFCFFFLLLKLLNKVCKTFKILAVNPAPISTKNNFLIDQETAGELKKKKNCYSFIEPNENSFRTFGKSTDNDM